MLARQPETDGLYDASQQNPGMTIPFRVEGDRMLWGADELPFRWTGARWEEEGNEDHYIYFLGPPQTEERFYIEHDLSTTPVTVLGGTWAPQ